MSEFHLLETLFDRLFPICRSLAGPGLRQSLEILRDVIPMDIESVPTGTQVFDWTVPPEWHIRGARLSDSDGRVHADFQDTNLAVVSYSIPVHKQLSLNELKPHLYSIPELPDAIPYVTSYYQRTWGFCLPHRVVERLPEGQYEAWIDSELTDGHLHYGHALLPGETEQEILLSSYLCHPSLANNELSGPLVLALLFQRLSRWGRRRYTYRFVLNPETIGSLVYLQRYGDYLKATLQAGLVLTCLGGPDRLSYKLTRRETDWLDQTVLHMKEQGQLDIRIRPFSPLTGSDERQYCSPGFNLPVGQMARTVYREYAQYHTSLDTKEFMGIGTLIESANQIEQLLQTLEYAGIFHNQCPYGEVQLSRRGLYPPVNSPQTRTGQQTTVDGGIALSHLRMILYYSDGQQTMVEIAKRCGCTVQQLIPAVNRLEQEHLLGFERRPPL